MAKTPKRILVTGALGQIGSELTLALRERYGRDNVVASDIRPRPPETIAETGPYCTLDVTYAKGIDRVIREYRIDSVFHLAALLSAKGEREPMECWRVNMKGDINILEAARQHELARIFVPSSIAVFGPRTPRDDTPQETTLNPQTMYGITKVAGEMLGDYYVSKYGLDIRGVRYPGIISSETPPGGGTTDYAVEIFYEAIRNKRYSCFVSRETTLPMMYMPDAIKAGIDLFEADPARLAHHTSFNVGSMSFSAGELADLIAKKIPGFSCEFKPDYRQAIADSWPRSVDDSQARKQWGWTPSYDLEGMVDDMLSRLKARHAQGRL